MRPSCHLLRTCPLSFLNSTPNLRPSTSTKHLALVIHRGWMYHYRTLLDTASDPRIQSALSLFDLFLFTRACHTRCSYFLLGEAVQYLPSTPARCFDNKRRTRCNGHHLQFSFSLYYDSSIYTIILETTTLNRYCLTCGRSTNPVMLEDQASLEYP